MKKLLFCSVALVLMSCGNTQNQRETISVDGSSTVYPVTEALAEEFRSVSPKTNVTIGISGTGGGFQKFGRGEIDVANASRPIKEAEAKIARENGVEFVELEVAYDGLAVIVHPENDWVESFTIEELRRIWEPSAQGNITHWNQINADWPEEEIHLYGPGVASGTFDYFTEAIVGESGSSRGDYTASEDDNVLVQGVSGDKLGLGFFGLAYYEANQDKLRLVPIDGGNGPVAATSQAIRDGSYSPLSRPLFIYVNSTSLSNPKVIEFMRFYLETAPDVMREVGYVPLTEDEYTAELETFNSFVKANAPEVEATETAVQ